MNVNFALQDRFLERFFAGPLAEHFYLTGSTALARFYMALVRLALTAQEDHLGLRQGRHAGAGGTPERMEENSRSASMARRTCCVSTPLARAQDILLPDELVEGAMRSQNTVHAGSEGGFAAHAVFVGVGEEVYGGNTIRRGTNHCSIYLNLK